jgi:hypothetical protein
VELIEELSGILATEASEDAGAARVNVEELGHVIHACAHVPGRGGGRSEMCAPASENSTSAEKDTVSAQGCAI